jgi:hypothetical protein
VKALLAAAIVVATLGLSAESAKAEWVYRTWHTGWRARTVWVPQRIWQPYRYYRLHPRRVARVIYYPVWIE